MSKYRASLVTLSIFAFALLVGRVAQGLDRAPEVLDHRQDAATNTVRVLWAPGGKADGTIDPAVEWYTLQRKNPGSNTFNTLYGYDEDTMSYVDPGVGDWTSWTTTQGLPVAYRVVALSNGTWTYSEEVSFVPAIPLFAPGEILDGKVQLAWLASPHWYQSKLHLGYRVQKQDPVLGWIDLHAGVVTQTSFIDSAPATGVANRYRVFSVYTPGSGGQSVFTSNEVEITLQPTCEGQDIEPTTPALEVVEITDRDGNPGYTGSDIVEALEICATKTYQQGGSTVTGGCVLRALPVTYENVAIKITYDPVFCTESYWTSKPLHCLLAGPGQPFRFDAGLVIEGYGSASVFRSPLWTPPYMPGAVLEIHRQAFPLSMRNIVLDGRKHEQQAPGMGAWSNWFHLGLFVSIDNPWNNHLLEVSGDSLGNDNGHCDFETNPFQTSPYRIACAEAASGNDGDGRCEAGEACVDGQVPPGTCDEEAFANAEACVSNPEWENSDGCIHNVEVRNFFSASAVAIAAGKRWIVEDSEIHDVGCVNRGYGYDCPHFDAAPDASEPSGFKTYGIALSFSDGTSEFQVRRNEIWRATKYGISFKNADATTCNGILKNHEVANNTMRDLGAVGIFNHGTEGARIHHNTIGRTTTWNEPSSMNSYQSPFGMSLGSFCTDDNEFSYNTITDSGGMAILWNGSTEKVACTGPAPVSCTPVAPVGNVIRDSTIEGVCLEKDTAPPSGTFTYAAIQTGHSASGTLLLQDNILTDSQCRFPIAVFGQNAWIEPFELRVEGGSYESGVNAATAAQNSFYCGAIHAHGDNREIVIGDDVEFTNPDGLSSIPKACLLYGAKVIVDGAPDPFAPGPFSAPVQGHLGSEFIDCSLTPTHPDCL